MVDSTDQDSVRIHSIHVLKAWVIREGDYLPERIALMKMLRLLDAVALEDLANLEVPPIKSVSDLFLTLGFSV